MNISHLSPWDTRKRNGRHKDLSSRKEGQRLFGARSPMAVAGKITVKPKNVEDSTVSIADDRLFPIKPHNQIELVVFSDERRLSRLLK